MKVTAIISILLCFAFVISLALTGCKKKNDPYFMNSSEYDSLISEIESNKNNVTSSEEDKTPENTDQKDVVPSPVPDKDGDTIDDSSSASTSTPSTPSTGSSPTVAEPSSTPSTSASSSSSQASSSTSAVSSSWEPSSSSNKNITTTPPDGAIDIIV